MCLGNTSLAWLEIRQAVLGELVLVDWSLYIDSFQMVLAFLPVRQQSAKQPIELRPMIVVSQVTEFVHYDVVDAPNRCVDEQSVQKNSFCALATSPASFHSTNMDQGSGRDVTLGLHKADVQPALEDLLCLASVPRQNQSLNSLLISRIWQIYIQEGPAQPHRFLRFHLDLQPILPPQIAKRLTTNESLPWRMWLKLLEVPELFQNPRHSQADLCFYSFGHPVRRSLDDNSHVGIHREP